MRLNELDYRVFSENFDFQPLFGPQLVAKKKFNLSTKFITAIDYWAEMVNSTEAAIAILEDDASTPFKKPPKINKLYRAIRTLYKQNRNLVIPYASDIQGALAFTYSFDIPANWYIIEKEFRPNDFYLDYSSMIEYYGLDYAGEDEFEIWMRNTPYYNMGTEEEVVKTFQT